ncbi:MAG TPA: hypothetical protein VFG30_21850 [Polyangiales bacterium]|nr:hypothetical protein [Polyangiales bacterium]
MKMMRFSDSWPVVRNLLRVTNARVLTSLLLLSACSSDDPATPGNVVVAGAGGAATSSSAGTTSTAGTAATGAAGTGISMGSAAGRASMPSTAGAAGQAAAGSGGRAAPPGGDVNMGAAGQATPAGAGGMMATAGMPATAGAGGAPGTTPGTPTKSPGCGMAPPANDTGTMITAGMVPYILDMPPGYDNNKAYPLLFVWHGFGVDNASFHGYLNMKAVAGNDAIIVTPEIIGGGAMWPQNTSYFDGLYEHFTTKYCVDTNRVFTTGHSMGGMHTALLGCQRADKLRGNAVLAAPHATGQCVDGNMALMLSVGDSDTVVSANHDTEFKWYAERNGCNASMSMPVDPMQCVEYAGCMPNKPVRTCRFAGGHEIPGWVAGAVWGLFKKL